MRRRRESAVSVKGVSEGREPVQLCTGGGCAACRGALGCLVEPCRDRRIRSVRGVGQVERTLLRIVHRVSEHAVHRLTLPDRCLLVADRGVQRMREAEM